MFCILWELTLPVGAIADNEEKKDAQAKENPVQVIQAIRSRARDWTHVPRPEFSLSDPIAARYHDLLIAGPYREAIRQLRKRKPTEKKETFVNTFIEVANETQRLPNGHVKDGYQKALAYALRGQFLPEGSPLKGPHHFSQSELNQILSHMAS